ncbi:ABC transporter ATP-binding protein [Arthrobacter crystallopoietes]|uniref:ATP-binding cassette, subfamily B n=1 Tax=Crystallibacter crystallopoietes TaxID=37928 RepID=A0A1H1EVP1_9MICC|nr:ABC transporter ATP-binding protein [Arthrobacter crystallopoietes]AUI49757.1 protein tyrosine phosphatase [Arthrobacter crystallopoietes]SDQ92791.1 ATP-binding cassette, subfamily B [Arthrobacter crystallopoietes]
MSRKQASPAALRRTLGIIRPHVGRHKLLMGGGITALLFEVVFRVLEPWPVKFVVDAVTRSLGADLAGSGPTATPALLLSCALATICIVGFRALANYLATVAFALAGSRVAAALRVRVFSHVQALSDRYHSSARTGDTVQRLVGDIGRLQEVAVTAGLPLVANVITLVVMAGVMFWLDPLLALVVVLAAAAFLLISGGSTGKITAASRKTRKGEGALANTAQESLGAIRVVQAYGLEGILAGKFSNSNKQALTEGVQARRLAAGLERRTDVIVGVATAAVLFGGGMRVAEAAMTPGDLVIFLTYLKTAMKPLRDLAKYTGRIARATASGERVADLLDERVDIQDAPGAVELSGVRGEIRLQSVRAAYGDGRPVLHHVNLHIPAGQKVAVVGPSGSGKSTLASLLVRMMDPVHGCVSVDGHDLREVTLASLRSQVSLLLQDSVLFTGTIRDNIRYGRMEATDEEVEQAARRAQAHGFIVASPDGYDTVVGERGSTLSGGQRQRLAIARALLRHAPVVVLDEATTGLDPEAASEVLAALGTLTEGRTTVTITHDAGPALAADRVLWVQGGNVVLDGTPAELLDHPSGTFKAWVEQQQAANASEAQVDAGHSAGAAVAEVV